jgi:hypothetical protein
MIIKKRTAILIAVVILALGLIGTGLSALYEQNEFITFEGGPMGTLKASYGFPLSWYGYSQEEVLAPISTPKMYWFSLESFLLDTALWLAISSFVCITAIKSVMVFRKARDSKILSAINPVVMYFFASLSFLVAGPCLSLFTPTNHVGPFGPPPPNSEYLIRHI